MITKIPNSTLIAAWIGLLSTQAAGAHEFPALPAVPAAKVVAAKVLAPLAGHMMLPVGPMS
jgi:hypothetical protein